MTYDRARVIVGRTKGFDTLDIIPKEMKLDRFEAERLRLSGHWFWWLLRFAGSLTLASLRILGICLDCVKRRAGHTDKVP